jgi:hypothetical protein
MTTRQAGGIALVLLVLSAFLTVAFRSIELVEERHNLYALHDLQDNSMRAAAKLQHQFEALAAGVEDLAAGGDGNAKTVIEEMRRRGVVLPARKH